MKRSRIESIENTKSSVGNVPPCHSGRYQFALCTPPLGMPRRDIPYRSGFRTPPTTADLRHSAFRNGMTLIELLVVIVILMTLVGGVIPVLSPNNDARRIREASRGLQTFVMQAQARSARTGRPAGIAFRESSPGSGVALEVFQIEVPLPFAGFSAYSASRVQQNLGQPDDLKIQFVLTNTLNPDLLDQPRKGLIEYDIEQIPQKFVKYGDIVVVSGIAYRLTDLNKDEEGFYFGEPPEDPQVLVQCELVDDRQTLAIIEEYRVYSARYGITAPKAYRIFRQPRAVTSSAEAPYQLPAGVCIDLQASGVEASSSGAVAAGMPVLSPSDISPQAVIENSFDSKTKGSGPTKLDKIQDTVNILFAPNGSIDKIYYGTRTISSVPRLYLLLGRVENGGLDLNTAKLTTGGTQGQTGGSSKEQVAEIQQRINWMNLDSRWIVVDARSGRTTVSENTFVDPSDVESYEGSNNPAIAKMQTQDAREFARQMKRGGER